MLVLERTEYLPDRTVGTLHAYHGRSWPTLELPWRDNAKRISCIPEGRYRLLRDRHGRHQWYRIADVDVYPRSAIELHPASRPDQLEGCIGIALEHLHELAGMCPAEDVLWVWSRLGPARVEET